jgi:hypothetical protein
MAHPLTHRLRRPDPQLLRDRDDAAHLGLVHVCERLDVDDERPVLAQQEVVRS